MNRVARAAAAHRAASRDHAVVHRVAALLLEYPTPDLLAMLPTLRRALGALGPGSGHLRAPLDGVLDHLGSRELTDLEAGYVTTFDLARRRSLYLSYYAFGDTRKRGLALVQLKQAYRRHGFELSEDELPDHLAVVLEFASTGDQAAQEAGLGMLLEHRAGLELLRLALLDLGSPYAGAVVAVCATLPPLAGEDRAAVGRLAAEGPPGEEVGLEPFLPPSFMPDAGARR